MTSVSYRHDLISDREVYTGKNVNLLDSGTHNDDLEMLIRLVQMRFIMSIGYFDEFILVGDVKKVIDIELNLPVNNVLDKCLT